MTSGQLQTHNLILLPADFFGVAGEWLEKLIIDASTKRQRATAAKQMMQLAKLAGITDNINLDGVSIYIDASGARWIAFHRQHSCPSIRPAPHCDHHPHFEYDCLECADALKTDSQ